MAKQVVDYHLYRWRYGLGYGFVVVAIIAAVVLAGLFIPGELRQGAKQPIILPKSYSRYGYQCAVSWLTKIKLCSARRDTAVD